MSMDQKVDEALEAYIKNFENNNDNICNTACIPFEFNIQFPFAFPLTTNNIDDICLAVQQSIQHDFNSLDEFQNSLKRASDNAPIATIYGSSNCHYGIVANEQGSVIEDRKLRNFDNALTCFKDRSILKPENVIDEVKIEFKKIELTNKAIDNLCQSRYSDWFCNFYTADLWISVEDVIINSEMRAKEAFKLKDPQFIVGNIKDFVNTLLNIDVSKPQYSINATGNAIAIILRQINSTDELYSSINNVKTTIEFYLRSIIRKPLLLALYETLNLSINPVFIPLEHLIDINVNIKINDETLKGFKEFRTTY